MQIIHSNCSLIASSFCSNAYSPNLSIFFLSSNCSFISSSLTCLTTLFLLSTILGSISPFLLSINFNSPFFIASINSSGIITLNIGSTSSFLFFASRIASAIGLANISFIALISSLLTIPIFSFLLVNLIILFSIYFQYLFKLIIYRIIITNLSLFFNKISIKHYLYKYIP
ncbi:hypothetical protein SDC9_145659 [bioreactor metagenome]|uniref:Uncharacterized protein n=1 Tax=bioreactor metagenome TaxID=1076179 RepID=A0A645EAN4_9ZZZZ